MKEGWEDEEDLLARIIGLIRNCDALSEYAYRIRVAPAVLDAESIINKHYGDEYRDWYEANHDDKYNPNKFAKPIDLILYKDDVPKLAILFVLSRWSKAPSLSSNPLSGWIAHWCKDNNVSRLSFYLNKPNKSHYILRRICEVLGEIPDNGYRFRMGKDQEYKIMAEDDKEVMN